MILIIHFEDNTQLILNNVISRKINNAKYFIKCKNKDFEFDTKSIKCVDITKDKENSA